MESSLPAHIREFAGIARDRFTMLGGPQAALRAESDQQVRTDAAAALVDLGAGEPAADLAPKGRIAATDVDLYLILSSWWLLGALEQALHIAGEHVRDRIQFGRALSEFQAVRFSVADAAVAIRGLEELAKFTVSRWASVEASFGRS